MKKLLIGLLLIALLLPSALADVRVLPVRPVTPTVEPEPTRTLSGPQLYNCYGVTFIAPDGFTRQETDEEELVFVNAEKSAAVQVFATEAEGLTWGNARTYLSDKYQYRAFSCNTSAKINGIPCINCVYADEFEPAYGRITVFLDEAEAVAWVFIFHSLLPLTDADRETWSDLLCSISAPMFLPTPTPTLEPTPTPTPPPLDFKAVNRNPEKYKYMDFMIKGRVLQVIEGEADENGYTTGQFRLATDGEYGDEIYCYYRHGPNDDRILEDDLIEFTGQCQGLYTYTSIRKVQISLPLFYIFSDIHIIEE